MLFFILKDGSLDQVTTEYPNDRSIDFVSRNSFTTLAQAECMAQDATRVTGKLHIATDSGANCYPRYDVIAAPAIGDKVSQSFNGDSYPRGTIVKVSKTLKKITTSDGTATWEFYRRGTTGSWLIDGYASMIAGHVREYNPSF